MRELGSDPEVQGSDPSSLTPTPVLGMQPALRSRLMAILAERFQRRERVLLHGGSELRVEKILSVSLS